jgi:hypothetical protein
MSCYFVDFLSVIYRQEFSIVFGFSEFRFLDRQILSGKALLEIQRVNPLYLTAAVFQKTPSIHELKQTVQTIDDEFCFTCFIVEIIFYLFM